MVVENGLHFSDVIGWLSEKLNSLEADSTDSLYRKNRIHFLLITWGLVSKVPIPWETMKNLFHINIEFFLIWNYLKIMSTDSNRGTVRALGLIFKFKKGWTQQGFHWPYPRDIWIFMPWHYLTLEIIFSQVNVNTLKIYMYCSNATVTILYNLRIILKNCWNYS